MPQVNFYLDEEENKIVEKYSEEWQITNKGETIRKIIKKFEELNGNTR